MGYFKFSPELFLESQEMTNFRKLLDDWGWRTAFLKQVKNFGIIKNSTANFDSLRIVPGTSITPNPTLKLKSGVCVDVNGQLITVNLDIDNIPIPTDTDWYWVKIAWQTTTIEQGSLSIDASGNVTGVGTLFTTTLRGVPNFPSRVQFYKIDGTTPLNYLQFDLLSITDDTHLTLNGTAFSVESGLQYAIVGTYTPGISIPSGNQFPYQYDSCLTTLVLETVPNTPPTITPNVEFLIARVQRVGTYLSIQDERTQIFQTFEDYRTNNLNPNWPSGSSGIVGVEETNWGTDLSCLDYSVVVMAWAFRSTNYTFNSTLNLVTINGGNGGSYKSTTQFNNGDFDGGRIYLSDGTFLRILTSYKSGTQINCYVESITNVTPLGGDQILVTPDAEEIEIMFSDEQIYPPQGNPGAAKTFLFPINTDVANCELRCYSGFYNIDYRFKTNYNYTPWAPIANGSYIDEITATRGYTGTIGIQLMENGSSYANTYKGDVYGIGVTAFTTTPVYTVYVGHQYQYLIFRQPSINYSTDLLLDIEDATRNGQRFVFWFEKGITFDPGYTLKIVTNYDAIAHTYDLIYAFHGKEIDFLNSSTNTFGVRKECVFNGTNWYCDSTNEFQYSVERSGTIVMWSGNPTGQFDGTTGLGLSSGDWSGWALCNGQNSTADLRGKFVVGYDPAVSDYNTIGNTGGEKTHILTAAESGLPAHNHEITGTGSFGSGSHNVVQIGNDGSGSFDMYQNPGSGYGIHPTVNADASSAHENRPPFYTLAYVQKL